MLFRTLPTTLLQIFSKIILNSKVSVKSILDPDDNFLEKCLIINGLSKAIFPYHSLTHSKEQDTLGLLEVYRGLNTS